MAWTNQATPHHTTQHKRWRTQVLKRDAHQCQACGHQGYRGDRYMEADHIHNIQCGGDPYDPDNGQTLCKPCHQKKTQAESHAGRLRRSGRRGTMRHPSNPA